MKRILPLLFFLLISSIFLIKPKPVQAASCSWTVTPSTVNVSDSTPLIIQGNNCANLLANTNYTVYIYPTSAESTFSSDYKFNWYTVSSPGSSNEITLSSFSPLGVNNTSTQLLGTWSVKICSSNKSNQCTQGSSNIIGQTTLQVTPNGGQMFAVYPASQNVQTGYIPQLLIINPGKNTYKLWWDNDSTNWSVTGNDANMIYPVTNHGDNTNNFFTPGQKKLCIALDGIAQSTSLGAGLPNCNGTDSAVKSVIFNFVSTQLPNNITCQIVPPNPSVKDDVSLLITNLQPNKDTVNMDLASSDTTKSGGGTNSQLAGANGIVLFDIQDKKNLGTILQTGLTYTPTLTYGPNSSQPQGNNLACNISPFTVSNQSTVGSSATFNCTPGDPKCTSSAGIYCNLAQQGSALITETAKDQLFNTDPKNVGILTAIGCVPTDPFTLIDYILRIAATMGGGISLLLMIFGAFQVITSAGNPEAVKKGRDQFTSAAIGLLFVLMAVTLLQVIGVNILQIPGFQP